MIWVAKGAARGSSGERVQENAVRERGINNHFVTHLLGLSFAASPGDVRATPENVLFTSAAASPATSCVSRLPRGDDTGGW